MSGSPKRKDLKRRRWPWLVLLLLLALGLLNHVYQWYPWPWSASGPTAPPAGGAAPAPGPELPPGGSTPSGAGPFKAPSTAAATPDSSPLGKPSPEAAPGGAGPARTPLVIDYDQLKAAPAESPAGPPAPVQDAGPVAGSLSPAETIPAADPPPAAAPAPSPTERASAKASHIPPAKGTVPAAASAPSPAKPSATPAPDPAQGTSPVSETAAASGTPPAAQPPASEKAAAPVLRETGPSTRPETPKAESVKALVEARKQAFGLDESVDMVVKPGESIRVGKETVPLDDILAQIRARTPAGPETRQAPPPPGSAKPSPAPAPGAGTRGSQAPPPEAEPPFLQEIREDLPAGQRISFYGIYLVKPGDNLWNIHFNFLREYFRSRGIVIAPDADEPRGSHSSGVGRILKYAENMVYVFSLKTRQITGTLDRLRPRERIVVFNLSNLDRILSPLSAGQLDSVRFDGQTLVPGKP